MAMRTGKWNLWQYCVFVAAGMVLAWGILNDALTWARDNNASGLETMAQFWYYVLGVFSYLSAYCLLRWKNGTRCVASS